MMLRRKMRGFTLIEMMIVIAIILIASASMVMSIQPALKNARVASAYNTALMAMRQARDSAVSEQQVYTISITASNVTVTQVLTGTTTLNLNLPTDVSFAIQSGVPTSITGTPDGFGTASYPIDLAVNVPPGGTTSVNFYPDGTVRTATGVIANGVVYISRTGDLFSSRAITMWGSTGRMRGWRLYQNAGTNYWRQQ